MPTTRICRTRVPGKSFIGRRIRRTRTPTKNSSATRCAVPVSSTEWTVHRLPFVSGLEGGLDVRTTIRFWHEDQVYVRRHLPGSESIRNGVIDWTSRAEDSKILRGGVDEEQGGMTRIRLLSAASLA